MEDERIGCPRGKEMAFARREEVEEKNQPANRLAKTDRDGGRRVPAKIALPERIASSEASHRGREMGQSI